MEIPPALIAHRGRLFSRPRLIDRMEIAKQFLFSGRVQGVGFRYSTKRLAMGFDVVGWVSNLEDGRVEMRVMGEEEELGEFLEEIHDSALGHHIREQEERTIPPLDGVRGFSIQ